MPRTTARYGANGQSPVVPYKLINIMAAILAFGVLLLLVNVYQLRSLSASHYGDGGVVEGDPDYGTSRRPVVWILAKQVLLKSL